jgi:hypothetical protein
VGYAYTSVRGGGGGGAWYTRRGCGCSTQPASAAADKSRIAKRLAELIITIASNREAGALENAGRPVWLTWILPRGGSSAQARAAVRRMLKIVKLWHALHHVASKCVTRAKSASVLTSGPGCSTLSATRISRPFSNARNCSSFSCCSRAVRFSDAIRNRPLTR